MEGSRRGTYYLEREKKGGIVNHWVHMEECHLVNIVPELLMILAEKQTSPRPKRKKLSPTITPMLCSPCFVFLRFSQPLVTDYRSPRSMYLLMCYVALTPRIRSQI